jgi:hypothetical protein
MFKSYSSNAFLLNCLYRLIFQYFSLSTYAFAKLSIS